MSCASSSARAASAIRRLKKRQIGLAIAIEQQLECLVPALLHGAHQIFVARHGTFRSHRPANAGQLSCLPDTVMSWSGEKFPAGAIASNQPLEPSCKRRRTCGCREKRRPVFFQNRLSGPRMRRQLPRLAVLTIERLKIAVANLAFRIDDDRAAAVHVEELAVALDGARLGHFADEIEQHAAVRRGAPIDAYRLHEWRRRLHDALGQALGRERSG